MSNYNKITDYAAKDLLLTGDAAKAIKGTEVGAEFDAIATMSATKVDSGGALGTPSSGTLTNCTGLPVAGITDSTTEALGVGSIELGHATDTTITRTGAGAIAVEGVAVLLSGGALGTPSSGTVTNLTGTASININGTVGATTPAAGTFTTLTANTQLIGKGTATNDDAAAGYIGEYVSSTIALGSAVSLTSSVAADVTSISLTAGDWDVSAFHAFIPAATTNATNISGSISTTSATHNSSSQFRLPNSSGLVYGGVTAFPGVTTRLSLASTTTVYLVASSGFTVSTMAAYGSISARRVR